MAVGLLIAGAALATTGLGIGAKGGYDQVRAEGLNHETNNRLRKAAVRLEGQRTKCASSLEHLGQQKIYVLNNSIAAFLEEFTKIKNVDFKNSLGLEELANFKTESKEFKELAQMSSFTNSMLTGVSIGAASGAVIGFGAYGLATALATASTGTAISTLSGVAATNATLAWFGGGSLAVGGMGVTGGIAVLSGIVTGPALLAMGIIIGQQGGKEIEKAKINALMANEHCAEYEKGSLECIAIRRRSYMFYSLLARLDAVLTPLCSRMQQIIQNEGDDYARYSAESKKIIAETVSTALSVKAVLDTPILTAEGGLSDASENILSDVSKKLPEQ